MVNPAITVYGTFRTGQVVDIPDDMDKTWVKTGLAEPVVSGSGEQIEGCHPVSFFCHACLLDKPAPEASPDPRYCQGCYDFLLKEAKMLPDNKHPKWIPRTQSKKDSTGKIGHQKSIQVSGDMVLNMSTVNGKKSEVDIIQPPVGKVTCGKRGPKQKALPQELIKQWADEGMGSKAIASRLKSEFGMKVSYKTVQRALSSNAFLTPA